MSENTVAKEVNKTKPKREIFLFQGEKLTGMNLEHVTAISIEGKNVTFNFYTNAISVAFDSEEVAKLSFDQLLKVWAGDVEVRQPEPKKEV